jgi:hypothetical protein
VTGEVTAGAKLWPAVWIGWAIAAVVLIAISIPGITHLWFTDPDDAMRLLEVRDWLNGQSWWDVSQHRLWGGHFAMHWSRLVDLPLALVMVVFDPILGQAVSTRIALVTVPLATLLAVMALGAEMTRRLAGVERAKMAVILAALSTPLLYQLRPMRIDHHGWQIACAMLAVVMLLGRSTARSGVVAGLSLGVLLTISLEGMPITAAIVGVAAIAWTIEPARRNQLLAMLWTLTGTVIAFQAITRGPGMFAPACDAIAPSWIAGLFVASVGAGIATIVPRTSRVTRVAMLGAVGGAALATLAYLAPQCLRGPFASLDPFVYRYWYLNVAEGLPVWRQTLAVAVMTLSFPVIGLIGGVLGWRAADGAERSRWTLMLTLAGLSFLLSLLVIRTGATANALALPGGAYLLHAMLSRARAIGPVASRTLATAAALLAATPGIAAQALFGSPQGPVGIASGDPAGTGIERQSCHQGHEIADLSRLPPALIFAPLDVSPYLLVHSGHRAIASAYHRNDAAIHRVMATFMADPSTARTAVLATGAAYVVGCPGENETEIYKKAAPNGLWARLERGEHIDWLQPVPIPGSPVLAWRVIASPGHPATNLPLSDTARGP